MNSKFLRINTDRINSPYFYINKYNNEQKKK